MNSVANTFVPAGGAAMALVASASHAAPGASVPVDVRLVDPDSPVSGAAFSVDYPVAALRLNNAAAHVPGTLVSGSSFVLWNVAPSVNNYATQSGLIRCAASAPTEWPGSAGGGQVARLNFTVQDGATAQPAWEVLLRDASVSSSDGYGVSALPGVSRFVFVGQPLTFLAWRVARFSPAQLADPMVSGWNADPDGNGFPNGAEYFGAAHPLLPESTPSIKTLRHEGPEGTCLELSFVHDVRAIEGGYRVEVSTDGDNWSEVLGGQPAMALADESVDYVAGLRTLVYRSTASLTDVPRLLVRLAYQAP